MPSFFYYRTRKPDGELDELKRRKNRANIDQSQSQAHFYGNQTIGG